MGEHDRTRYVCSAGLRACAAELYRGDGSPNSPRFMPLLYPSFEGLPPAYIHAMGLDSLRDDAIIYEKALREAGVRTQIKVFPGVGHGFWAAFPDIGAAERVRRDIAYGLGWLLGRGEA
ncbi:Alpha/Beta hydrolase protein [Epithele typhae]|uniref:Alpha/Beta hydrolase protein n=1 Tax=Epithele typhae TaxID=378194 RepID=UPI002007D767|nr:Alpha/Beta hydrolase protein [Epithele typhae]KAH9940110.1 Alpha/Beta hydrolase protein [Epithele typhae]